jgi:hypothetical protein
MKRLIRAVLVAAAATAALAFAAPAFASFTATVSVTHGRLALGSNTSTAIHIAMPQSNDAAARIAIYVPQGYTANFGQSTGATIGATTASAFSHDTNLTLPLSGTVSVDDPAKHTTDACSPGTNAAVWILNLTVAGQTIALPVYVNPTTGNETALGAYKIVTCLPPWDVPQGTPGRSFQGAQVLDAKFTVNGIFTTPSTPKTYVWSTLFTPYNPGVGTANPLGTIEARSLVPLPVVATLRAKYVVRTNTFQLFGTLSLGGQPANGITVKIFRGTLVKNIHQVASTRVKNGKFSTAGHLKPRKTTYFQVRASSRENDVTSTGCLGPASPAPRGCVSATTAPWSVQTAYIRIKL